MTLGRQLRTLASVMIKNFQRMVQSKLYFGAIFLGPFIILLLLHTAYSSSDTLNLDIGLVKHVKGPFEDDFASRLGSEFNLYSFSDIETCTNLIERGKIDVCVLMSQSEKKPTIDLYVDYSKLSLITTLLSVMSDKVNTQTNELKGMLLNELVDKIKYSSDSMSLFQNNFNLLLLGNQSPSVMLSEVQKSLENVSGVIVSARLSIDEFQKLSKNSFEETQKSLSGFKNDLEEVRDDAVDEKEDVSNIKNYYSECDDNDILEALTNPLLSDQEALDLMEEYGKCKCVDFFRGKLDNVERDLGDLIENSDDAIDRINNAKRANSDLYDGTTNVLDTQRENLKQYRSNEAYLLFNMQKFNRSYFNTVRLAMSYIGNMSKETKTLSAQAEISGNTLKNPVLVSVNPISQDRELLVYVFPLVYFFILMFIALIFSSTFTFSEKNSRAFNRNSLAPLNKFVESLALFLSILITVLIQGGLLILLANFFFNLGIVYIVFFKMMAVSVVLLSLFVLIGMFFGYLLKSELMVMLSAISASILLFFYTGIIRPLEMMPSLAKSIISYNPFYLGSDAVTKIIMFNVSMNVFTLGFYLLLAEILFFVLLLFFVKRK